MTQALKQDVFEANRQLVRDGLVLHTFGNVSGVDRERGIVAIKPSGVPYESLRPQEIVLVSIESGQILDSALRPSSDTPTHLALYRAFPSIGGVAHTHSLFATAWAQARREISPLGTTHADYFHGPVPCTRMLQPEEIAADYEAATGRVIAERFEELDPLALPGVLVAGHGPFTWGRSPAEAARNAAVLEYLARLASETLRLAPDAPPVSAPLLDRHFLRKHGPDAYYGQDS
jgi:L-ribulose-5-phosphate 4-epimerase